jgi:hypothetical protein
MAAILRLAPRVRGCDVGAKGSNPPLEKHSRPGLGRPCGSACVPARRRPSHHVRTHAARDGQVRTKEEERGTGRPTRG